MKKLLILLLPILFVFTECNKYPEGPKLSLRSKKQRLMNSWVIGQVFETSSGGSKTDRTTDYKNYYYNFNLIISDNNLYGMNYRVLNLTPYSETGSWAFSGSKEDVLFTNSNSNQTSSIGERWTILRLKEDELWMQNLQSNGTLVEAHFIPQ